MYRTTRAAIAWVTIASVVNCWAEDKKILNIGDAAPKLAISSWVKGEKIDKFEPGKTYVVEFWATWCGPCIASIPHLTELAHKHKAQGVRFVGVDILEADVNLVQPFVQQMGDKMDYAVAMDTIPEGKTQDEGLMATAWMKSAGEEGIPTAFVIKDGKIQWIGHPLKLDEPLAKIVAGDWDYAAQGRQRLVDKAKERKAEALLDRVRAPFLAKDYKATLAALEEVVKEDASLESFFAGTKFIALCLGGENKQGLEAGQRLMERYWDDYEFLNFFFWDVIDPKLKEVDTQIASLALKAIERAVELTKSENSGILDTLAVAKFRTGDLAGAISTEEKAIRVEKSAKEPAESRLREFNERIEWFSKTLAKETDTK